MGARAMLVILLALAISGCGGPAAGPPPDEARPDAARQGSAPSEPISRQPALTEGRGFAWEDPEPPGAQALAEEVLSSPWNEDRTTRLTMKITTLVDRTTGIEGFHSDLAGEGASLEDRLDSLGAEVTETEVTIRLPGSILFDFDSSALRPDAERTLAEVAKVVQAYAGRPVRVEGHTDSIASEAYNQGLSEQRALSVASWLSSRGVDRERLEILGRGETSPVADNATAKGRQLNRRVEIVIER